MKLTKLYNELVLEQLTLCEKYIYNVDGKIPLYKNPPSISRFPKGARAILTVKGDLYIVDDDGYNIIHFGILESLKVMNYLPSYANFNNYAIPFRKNNSGQILSFVPQSVSNFSQEYVDSVNNAINIYTRNNQTLIKFDLTLLTMNQTV